MSRWFLALALFASSASAQVVFEPEAPTPAVAAPAPPPTPPAPSWTLPQVDFRLVARLVSDLAFERNGENAAELYRFATASIHTEHGPFRFRLSARLRWVTSAEAPDSGNFWLFNGTRWRSAFEPSLGESYVSVTHWGIDWAAGFLDIAWGQNPIFSPSDVLTPIDLRDGPMTTADARIPVPAVKVRGQLGWLRWDAVWLPIFMPSKFPLFGNDWSPFALARPPVTDLSRYVDPTVYSTLESNPIATKLPQQDLSAPQGGLRLSTRLRNFDVAVSWAEFFDRQPKVQVSKPFSDFLQALQSGESGAILQTGSAFAASLNMQQPFTATYLRTRVFAVDAALSVGRARWTLDAGYSPARVFPLLNLTTTVHPMLSGALGFEWEGPPIIAAGIYSVLALSIAPEERLMYLESDPSPASGQRNVSLSLAYLAISKGLLDDRLQFAFNGIVTEHADFFLIPSLRWKIRDAHGLALGAHLIGGPHDGIGAAYHRNNEAFVEYVLQL